MRSIVSSGAVYCAVQGGSHFWVCGWNPVTIHIPVTIQMKAIEQYFPVVLIIML